MSDKLPITEQDYIDAAQELGCQPAAVKAVAQVESSGSGFLPTGELVILFEPHVFWRQLKKKGRDVASISAAHPELSDILYEKFKGHAGEKPSQQWERLRRAVNLPYNGAMTAGYEATSFGKFQIMGFNHEACGYADVFELVGNLNKGESYHLKAFVNLIKDFGLGKVLAAKNWAKFALAYNGPAYKVNNYDTKLAAAFAKYS
jgi:hypothetical protein